MRDGGIECGAQKNTTGVLLAVARMVAWDDDWVVLREPSLLELATEEVDEDGDDWLLVVGWPPAFLRAEIDWEANPEDIANEDRRFGG